MKGFIKNLSKTGTLIVIYAIISTDVRTNTRKRDQSGFRDNLQVSVRCNTTF